MTDPDAPQSLTGPDGTTTDDLSMNAVPSAPPTPPIELERLRRSVKSRLFAKPEEPLRIGRFVVLGCLGQGGMGIVYAAQDEELGRKVAIKLLRPELSSNKGSRRLSAEAKSLAKLSHPNVVAVFDVGEHDGQSFIAMEHVQGQTVREWLRTPRPVEEVVEVFLGAGRGLAAAHAVGLVHRDFKPDNVLVGADGRPRVLDFGLARPPERSAASTPPSLEGITDPLATSMTVNGEVLGTPAFMAPEQHLGESADGRSDQFAYCVALYQALYGELPFHGGDLRTLSLAIVRGRLPTPRADGRVPTALRSILERGLSVDPGRRFKSMDELLGELQALRVPPSAPTQPPLSLNTGQVEVALGHAARFEAAAVANPGLTPTEVVNIAGEAGLDPELARRAVEQVSRPIPVSRQGAGASLPMRVAGSPPERRSLGYQTVIGLHRVLPLNIAPHAVSGIIRELEREFGEKGQAEWIGASLVWTGQTADARFDPNPGGGVDLRLRRDHSAAVITKRKRAMLALGTAGFFMGLILSDAVSVPNDLELLLAFQGAVGGMLGGFFGMKRLHNHSIADDREQLGYLAERLESLLGSTPAPALEGGS